VGGERGRVRWAVKNRAAGVKDVGVEGACGDVSGKSDRAAGVRCLYESGCKRGTAGSMSSAR
jgi:hypothetical protein